MSRKKRVTPSPEETLWGLVPGKKARCMPWKHSWGPATAPGYEVCQNCSETREIEKHILPAIEKKEGQEHESQPDENRRAQ